MQSIALWLSFILIFMIPWENAIRIAGIGTFTRIVGLVLVLFWILAVLARGGFRRLRFFHFAFFLFVLINIMSAFWTYNIAVTQSRIITYAQLFILCMILWDLIKTEEHLQISLQAYVLGAYISIGSIVINYFSGDIFDFYKGRYIGAEFNANDLALILCLGLPLAWHLVISYNNLAKNRLLIFVNYAYIPAAIFAIILTASRMGLIALVPAFIYIFSTMGHLKIGIRVLVFIALIVIVLALENFIPQSSIERFGTIGTSFAEGDLGGRVGLWYRTSIVFLDHPLLGIGSGALKSIMGGVAHNAFLSVLTELGVIGFISFILVLAIVLQQAVRQPKSYSGFWLTIFIIWTIGVSTLTWEHWKPTWLFMSLIIISANLFTKTKASKVRTSFTQRSTPYYLQW